MLRLPLSTSSAAAKSIGLQTARASSRLPRQQIVQSQRRWTSKDTDKVPVMPGGAGKDVPPVPAATKPVSPASPPTTTGPASTNPTQVPLTPPTPKTPSSPGVTPPGKTPASTSASSSTPPPPPPPMPSAAPKKKTHRLRNFLLFSTLLTGGAFAGGVYYSLQSDNFHDFFTEYVPFGEEAVLYFEEQEFRRRFPNAFARQDKSEKSVTIPKSSGATWRVADEDAAGRTTDVGKPGPHISASAANEERKERDQIIGDAGRTVPAEGTPVEPKVVDVKPAPPKRDIEKVEAAANPKGHTADTLVAAKSSGDKSGSLTEVAVSDAQDPIVQDLVSAINGIISAVNTTGSSADYAAAIESAKSELVRLNDQLKSLKDSYAAAAEAQIRDKDLEFTKAAQGLLTNVNREIEDLQHQWQQEFAAERDRIAQGYREKLSTQLQRAHELAEQRLHNELLEQAIEMKRKWIAEIQDRVENERNGRLGKIAELEAAVADLEKLTTEYHRVVDTNIQTQQIFTAVEAVRSAYSSPDQPRPFLREMAALKEVAAGDELIAAAIDAVNPAAYQNGVVTPPQLTDRFRKVAKEVRKAALLPEDAGVAAHAANWVLSHFMMRKKGLVKGDDVESVLTRAEMFLEEGDVDSAAREVNQLAGWARILAGDWLREARKWLEVEQAVEVIAAEARVQSLRMQK